MKPGRSSTWFQPMLLLSCVVVDLLMASLGNVTASRSFPCAVPTNQELKTKYDTSTWPSSVTHECHEGFDLTGSKTRICYENGTWDKLEPKCIARKSIPKANTLAIVVPILLIFCIGIIILAVYTKMSCKESSNEDIDVDFSIASSKNSPVNIDTILPDCQKRLLEPSDTRKQELTSGKGFRKSTEISEDASKQNEHSQNPDIPSNTQSLLCSQYTLEQSSPKFHSSQSHHQTINSLQVGDKENTDLSENLFPGVSYIADMQHTFDDVFNADGDYSIERSEPRKSKKSSDLDYADLDEIEVIRSLEKEECLNLGGIANDDYRRTGVSSRPLPEITEPLYISVDNEIYCAI